jgi:hypothetical protein
MLMLMLVLVLVLVLAPTAASVWSSKSNMLATRPSPLYISHIEPCSWWGEGREVTQEKEVHQHLVSSFQALPGMLSSRGSCLVLQRAFSKTSNVQPLINAVLFEVTYFSVPKAR